MRIEGDNVIMEDGTTYRANFGVIGISPDTVHASSFCEGFDGGCDIRPEHRGELADFMIGLWEEFKENPDG